MLNVIGIGRVANEIEVKNLSSGKKVTEFSIAFPSVKRSNEANFVKIVLFDKYAETMTKLLEKGNRVVVNGELEIEPFTRKDGSKSIDVKMINPHIDLLDKKVKQDKCDEQVGADELEQQDEDTKIDELKY